MQRIESELMIEQVSHLNIQLKVQEEKIDLHSGKKSEKTQLLVDWAFHSISSCNRTMPSLKV